MVDLAAFEAKVKESQAQVQAVAQAAEQALAAHNDLVNQIVAAQNAVPTIADVKAMIEKIPA